MPHARIGRGPLRLWYDVIEPAAGDGEPLLWLPGFALSGAAFDAVLPHYSSLRSITFDHRRTGRSRGAPGLPGLVSVPQLAGDAVGLLDALEIESAHVYGVSYGGMVAQELAIRFPDRVRGLILGGTTPGGPRAVLPSMGQLIGLAKDIGARGSGQGLAGAVFSPAFRTADPSHARALARGMRVHRAPLDGVLAHLVASTYHDTYHRLGRITAPTLVLHGSADTMTPLENARLLARSIPDAELSIVPGAGHAYLLEQPDESARRVLEFLERRRPVAGPAASSVRSLTEPVTRALGLPVGMARTARSALPW